MSGNPRWWQFKGWFKGANHLIFEKGRDRYGWFQKKYPADWFRAKKNRARKYLPWLCIIGKTNSTTKGLRKKILTQTKSPITPVKTQMVGHYLIKFLGLLAGPAEQFSKCGGPIHLIWSVFGGSGVVLSKIPFIWKCVFLNLIQFFFQVGGRAWPPPAPPHARALAGQHQTGRQSSTGGCRESVFKKALYDLEETPIGLQ